MHLIISFEIETGPYKEVIAMTERNLYAYVAFHAALHGRFLHLISPQFAPVFTFSPPPLLSVYVPNEVCRTIVEVTSRSFPR